MKRNKETEQEEAPPPLMKSWNRMYLLVLINLAVTILVFYLITLYFR